MGRAIPSLVVTLLLNCTLVFGGCISCAQFFMLPGATDCCKAGQCERSRKAPAKRDCQRMPMASSGEQPLQHGVSLLPATLPLMRADDLIVLADMPIEDKDAAAHPPPDRTILNATLLI